MFWDKKSKILQITAAEEREIKNLISERTENLITSALETYDVKDGSYRYPLNGGFTHYFNYILEGTLKKQIDEIKNNLKENIEKEIKSEQFIDSIIERINRKQLKN